MQLSSFFSYVSRFSKAKALVAPEKVESRAPCDAKGNASANPAPPLLETSTPRRQFEWTKELGFCGAVCALQFACWFVVGTAGTRNERM